MKGFLFFLADNAISRIFFIIIGAGSIASPYINGFSHSEGWHIAAAIFIVLGVMSFIFEFKFSEHEPGILYAVILLVIAFFLFLFMAYGL